MIKQIVSIGVVGLALISAVVFAAVTQTEASNNGGEKVRICHRTASQNNPYNSQKVSINGAGETGLGDHYSNHTGPVFNDTDQDFWGDIIPPVGDQPGLNWTELGQAIYNNDCSFPSKTATAAVSTIAATCETGETLDYGKIKNAVFSGTEDGEEGPGSYTVIATADKNALFEGNFTTITFSDSLAGPNLDLCEETEFDVASASVRFVAATCFAGEQLLYGEQDIVNATFSGTPSGIVGPFEYLVLATADEDARFNPAQDVSESLLVKRFSGDLAGPNLELCDDEDSLVAVAGVRIVDATCESPAILLYDETDVENAYFGEESTPSGTQGPADYSVTAFANEDARFPVPEKSELDSTFRTFEGTLEGTLTGDECVLGETPETPEVLPETNAATPLALIAAFSATAAAVAGLGFGLRSALGRKL